MSHLYQTAEVLGYEKEEREKWVKERLEMMSCGQAEKVIELLKEEYKKNPKDRLKALRGYCERFKTRLCTIS